MEAEPGPREVGKTKHGTSSQTEPPSRKFPRENSLASAGVIQNSGIRTKCGVIGVFFGATSSKNVRDDVRDPAKNVRDCARTGEIVREGISCANNPQTVEFCIEFFCRHVLRRLQYYRREIKQESKQESKQEIKQETSSKRRRDRAWRKNQETMTD